VLSKPHQNALNGHLAYTFLGKVRENSIVMEQINSNTAEQALLGDFSKAFDDAAMDSGAAHHNQIMQHLSTPQSASGFARVIFDLMLAGKATDRQAPLSGD
jgi:type I restriction enzyme R subunit